jgi:hypothetical protein
MHPDDMAGVRTGHTRLRSRLEAAHDAVDWLIALFRRERHSGRKL